MLDDTRQAPWLMWECQTLGPAMFKQTHRIICSGQPEGAACDDGDPARTTNARQSMCGRNERHLRCDDACMVGTCVSARGKFEAAPNDTSCSMAL